MSHIPYVNELPIDCVMAAFQISTSGQYEEKKAEFGEHIYGIGCYGLSQASQGFFGVPATQRGPFSAIPPSADLDEAVASLSATLEAMEQPRQAFGAGPNEAALALSPAMMAMLFEFAKAALLAWLENRKK